MAKVDDILKTPTDETDMASRLHQMSTDVVHFQKRLGDYGLLAKRQDMTKLKTEFNKLQGVLDTVRGCLQRERRKH